MFNKISRYFSDNGPALATVGSMVCTALAIIFAIKNADKGVEAKELYEDGKEEIEKKAFADRKPEDELRNKVMYAMNLGHAYKETFMFGAGAIVLAGTANKLNAKTIAGLSAALALREDKLKKLYKKAEEIYGGGAAPDLKEAVNCDAPPFDEDDVIKTKKHRKKEKVEKYYETHSGRMFESYPSDVDAALERGEKLFAKYDELNYNKLGSLLGLPDLDIGIVDEWNEENPFRPSQKIVMINGEECIGIIYDFDPVSRRGFKKLY